MSITKALKKAPAQSTASATNPTSAKQEPASNKFEGKVVSISGNKLVMRNKEGAAFTHTLAKDAKISCDGTPCKADALKPGNQIRVTTKKEDRNVATGVECLEKNKEFSTCCG